jgi:hypothetical protein
MYKKRIKGQSKLSCCCLAARSLRGRPLGRGVTRRRSASASWRPKLASQSAHPPLVAAPSASMKPGWSAAWKQVHYTVGRLTRDIDGN